MEYRSVRVVEGWNLPEKMERGTVYRLLPQDFDPAYYEARTDRNIGWITREEQELVRRSVVGVAGCGGMGGRLAEVLLRLGIGELRIADGEVFDVSNVNRQLAATQATIGQSKAQETARTLRAISTDTMLVVYPDGIQESTVEHFVCGCDVVCDEIEFWCVGSRILLHRVAREHGMPVFVCNTVGFGSHIFLFTKESVTMEECLGLPYEEAVDLEEKIANHRATEAEIAHVAESVTRGLFFEWPEYCAPDAAVNNKTFTSNRLMKEGKGAIIATNPPFACGFVADHILLYLLQRNGNRRAVVEIPPMPGYLYLDAAKMQAKVVCGPWW